MTDVKSEPTREQWFTRRCSRPSVSPFVAELVTEKIAKICLRSLVRSWGGERRRRQPIAGFPTPRRCDYEYCSRAGRNWTCRELHSSCLEASLVEWRRQSQGAFQQQRLRSFSRQQHQQQHHRPRSFFHRCCCGCDPFTAQPPLQCPWRNFATPSRACSACRNPWGGNGAFESCAANRTMICTSCGAFR